MNEDDQAFLGTICETPEDNAVLLVYADWLEERDDPRWEYVRLLVTVRQQLSTNPDTVIPMLSRYIELECQLPREWIFRVNGREVDKSSFFNANPFVWRVTEGANRTLDTLRRVLDSLSKAALASYYEQFRAATEEVNPCVNNAFGIYLVRGCSEDHGDDVGAWVVTQGFAFHQKVATELTKINEHFQMYQNATFHAERRLQRLRTSKKRGRKSPELKNLEEQIRWDRDRGDWIARQIYETKFGEDLF